MTAMKKIAITGCCLLLLLTAFCQPKQDSRSHGFSGNPLFPGWYADPEIRVFNKTYWIYPTFSAPYDEQVFLDAFSSTDLVHWIKHPHVVDTGSVHWARRAVW